MNTPCRVLPLHYRVTLLVLALLFCSAATHTSAQQVKPNFTGTWKINLSKSKLATPHGRDDRYKIKHLEPRLEMVHDDGETYRYVTDGKEHVAIRSPLTPEILAKTHWDGATLVIEKRQEVGPGGQSWVSRYTLSQDGKSLAVTHHFNKSSSFSAAFDELLTYEKQE